MAVATSWAMLNAHYGAGFDSGAFREEWHRQIEIRLSHHVPLRPGADAAIRKLVAYCQGVNGRTAPTANNDSANSR